MKAVFLDFATMGGGLDTSPLYEVTPDLTIHDTTSPEQVAERIHDVEIIYTNRIQLSDDLIEAAPKMRLIALTATGTDNIDLDSAARHGIAVCNIRDYCTESVVEHVFGVLLMLTHDLPALRRWVAAGEWQRSDDTFLLRHRARELAAMTMGIVGYGSLGQGVARIARAFGMEVVISARPGATEIPEGRVAFDDVLEQADVISLHCPLTEDTVGLFGDEQLARMKESAILINTARGGLVQSQALADGLESGEIAAAAVDVLPQEPPVDGDPLLDYEGDNLIITPHVAWATVEARQRALEELAANAAAFIEGQERNRVI